jgi:hypothetical protein
MDYASKGILISRVELCQLEAFLCNSRTFLSAITAAHTLLGSGASLLSQIFASVSPSSDDTKTGQATAINVTWANLDMLQKQF